MQALILAGGEGTRLRPLTSTVPKPVVPLVDRPFITYMLEWLQRHGVDDVVMSCGYMASGVRNVLGDGSQLGLRIRYVEEPRPLGTGGAVKFAEPLLDERFLMLNGDVLTDMDLTAQIEQHERSGARATIALIPVDDPSRYGLVRIDADRRVEEFLEKPSSDQIDTDLINAGAYVLEREVLDSLEREVNVSIEREVFPRLVGEGLYGIRLEGYWIDIGTPERYLEANWDILEGRVEAAWKVDDPAMVGEGCQVSSSAELRAPCVVGPEGRIGEGAVVERSVLLERCVLEEDVRVVNSILSGGVRVERGVELDGAVVGEDESVSAAVA
jgi:mannose-1-phosphate guanylyltransferase